VEIKPGKIKKSAERMTVELVRNADILESVAKLEPRPFTVGFAAETDNVVENARAKLARKNLDLVAANQVGQAGSGFEADNNQITLVERDATTELPAGTKQQLARTLIHHIAGKIHAGHRTKNPRQAHR
jgi:phosphopantothenoylcysteine decarboxylase/phosphopantothenate--cysteine ligase